MLRTKQSLIFFQKMIFKIEKDALNEIIMFQDSVVFAHEKQSNYYET